MTPDPDPRERAPFPPADLEWHLASVTAPRRAASIAGPADPFLQLAKSMEAGTSPPPRYELARQDLGQQQPAEPPQVTDDLVVAQRELHTGIMARLEASAAAGHEGAAKLLHAIKTNGTIVVGAETDVEKGIIGCKLVGQLPDEVGVPAPPPPRRSSTSIGSTVLLASLGLVGQLGNMGSVMNPIRARRAPARLRSCWCACGARHADGSRKRGRECCYADGRRVA